MVYIIYPGLHLWSLFICINIQKPGDGKMTKDPLSKSNPLIKLKESMHALGLTQETVAKELGITRPYFNMMLNGNKKLTEQTAQKLEDLTGLEAEFLLGKENGSYDPATDALLKDLFHKAAKTPEQSVVDRLVAEWKRHGSRDLTDGELYEAVKKEYIVIKPFDPGLLEPMSYRLRSDKILLPTMWDTYSLDNEDVLIQKDQKVAIMTKEWLEVPRNVSAVVTPTTNIMDEAVSMTSGFLIHPGYKGCLFFVLKNLTNREIAVKEDIEFLRVKFSFSKIDPERTYRGSKQKMMDFPDDFKMRFCDELQDKTTY